MRVLDLYCGGGGAGAGLLPHATYLEGWDLQDMELLYPGTFRQGSALDLTPDYIATFDFVWASPPCQRYSKATKKHGTQDAHPDLVEPTRDLLLASGVPFVMENVPGAPLRKDVMLCGLMFGLELLRRHRIFEVHGFTARQPEHPSHQKGARYITVAGNPGGSSKRDGANGFGSAAEWKKAMGIDWLPSKTLAQAIPPAYSDYLVKEYLRSVQSERMAG